MARFYDQPTLFPMLVAASLGLLIGPLGSTKITMANREMKRKELAVFGLVVQTLGVLTQIILAWRFRSVWALVIGGLATECVRVVASQFVFPGLRNRWRWDATVVREIQGFSTWIYFSSIMTFLGGQADRLLLGKLMPIEFLGIYGIAMNFASLPAGAGSAGKWIARADYGPVATWRGSCDQPQVTGGAGHLASGRRGAGSGDVRQRTSLLPHHVRFPVRTSRGVSRRC